MRHLIIALVSVLSIVSCSTINQMRRDNAQMREDIRHLLNDMDNNGDLDAYDGSDYVERLYNYTHK